MPDEPQNLTIRLLQDLRDSLARLETRMDSRFSELEEQITDLVQRVDGNTLVFNPVAGVVHHHEERIVGLEENRG